MPAHRDDELFNSPPIVTSLCDDDGYDNDEQIACVCVKKTKGTKKKKKKEKPFLTEPVCREAGKWWTANRCLCVEPIQIKLARKKKDANLSVSKVSSPIIFRMNWSNLTI